MWSRAWCLEDNLWASNSIINGDSLFRSMCGTSHYLSWWSLSDEKPDLRQMCEALVKIICSASRLKSDDLSLKGKPDSMKLCTNCDLGIVESAWHIIMQCPHNQVEISAMHNELSEIGDGSWEHVQWNDRNILHMILGCELPDLDKDQCNMIWEYSTQYIS